MRKLTVSFLALILCLVLVSCGSDDNNNNTGTDDDTEGVKIEKPVDAVAEELALGEGTETLYQTIGAEAGKEYKDGSVELYLFDEQSDEYEAIEDGSGAIQAAATNDGMVIITDDTALADEFEKIQFK